MCPGQHFQPVDTVVVVTISKKMRMNQDCIPIVVLVVAHSSPGVIAGKKKYQKKSGTLLFYGNLISHM